MVCVRVVFGLVGQNLKCKCKHQVQVTLRNLIKKKKYHNFPIFAAKSWILTNWAYTKKKLSQPWFQPASQPAKIYIVIHCPANFGCQLDAGGRHQVTASVIRP